MNASDIENMTVVALKKELKARNLSVTGNKSELVERLSNSVGIQIQHQEQTLETPAQNEASTTIAEVNNIEQELNAALITGSDLKDIESGAKSLDVSDDVLKEAEETVIAKELSTEKDTAAVTMASEAAIRDPSAKDKLVAALTEDDRKVLRAKKFNVPVVQTKESRAIRFGIETHAATVASDEVMKRRAERFGLSASANSHKSGPSDNSSQDDKLKQRALRFGTASASTASKIALSSIKASSSTSSKTTDSDQQEALLSRKRRFDESALSNKTSDSSVDDKKLARAQRFGLKA